MINKIKFSILLLIIPMLSFGQNYFWSHTKSGRYTDSGKAMAAAEGQSYLFISLNFGETWSTTAYTKDWYEVEISSTGKYILGAANGDEYIIMSSNSGTSWDTRTDYPTNDYQCCAVSGDGKYMYIADTWALGSDQSIYKSTDYGVTFTAALYPGGYWYSLDCSNNGQYLLGGDGYNFYLSTDYTTNWTDISSRLRNPEHYQSQDISETGQYMIAGIMTQPDFNDSVLVSKDYGLTWKNKAGNGFGSVVGVACSGTGKYMTYASNSGDIYVSSDYGNTWAMKYDQAINSASCIGISYTGKYQIVAFGNDGYMYRSTDYGQNWTQVTSAGARKWRDIDLR